MISLVILLLWYVRTTFQWFLPAVVPSNWRLYWPANNCFPDLKDNMWRKGKNFIKLDKVSRAILSRQKAWKKSRTEFQEACALPRIELSEGVHGSPVSYLRGEQFSGHVALSGAPNKSKKLVDEVLTGEGGAPWGYCFKELRTAGEWDSQMKWKMRSS